MYDVIALGELLVDLAERTKDENGYPTLAANPGGAPGNFLAALSAYGKKTAFLAKVGDDTFGHLLTGTMRRAGIDTRGILISPDTFTTLAFVTFDAHGDRSFAFARKPGADTQLRWEEIDPAMLEQARVFHFGSLSCTDEPARTATQKAAAYARAHGKLVTYDPNYRAPLWKTEQEAREQILWGLSQADIVKISDEETQFLWDCSPEEGAERVLALGAKLVMVTLGPKGCLLKNKQADFSCGCPKVHPIDTTGAGDAFNGGLLAALAEGKDIVSINFSSALSTTYQSACIAAQDMKEEFPDANIYVVDSLSASLGQGLLLYLTVQKKREGLSAQELVQWVEDNKLHIDHWFTVDDLNYLKMGGRLSAGAAFFGSMLSIKPVMHTSDEGKLVPVSKVRGRKASLKALIDKIAELGIEPSEQVMFICHADCEVEARAVAEEMKARYGVKEVYINYIGPVIGSHTGPNTMGIFFVGTKR